ncbi:MAG: oligosaccharide flippase family protein, partial [Patescibacteria group bacterium]|nr:oligosaccharide flippase family protein [Patescibacteria group bacterium]
MGYTKQAVSGFSWQTILKFLTYFLSLVKIYFLARLLSPDDFGLFSLTAIALGISESITQTGVNLTILQSKHSVKYFLNTAWVIAIVRGFVIGSLMIVLGLGMSKFFDQPQLLMLTSVAALIPVIKGFINPYIVILHKKMLFFQDTVYRFSYLAAEIILSILFGFILKSALALALGMVVAALFEVLISFIFFKKKPIFQYLPSRAKQIFSNTKWLSISSLLNYLSEQMDDFLIGRLTNTYSLGIYHNSYSLTHKANYQISKSVHHSTIPIFTKIKNNQNRLRKAFVKSLLATMSLVLFFSIP